MLNVGWPELVVIGVVALLVIGPKDLPELFRQLGRVMAKIRSMGRDFQRAMDEAARQTGVADVAKDLKDATSTKSLGLDGLKSAADRFEKWDPIKNAAKPTVKPKPAANVPVVSVAPATATPTVVTQAAAPATPGMGPSTQALYDKQTAKAAALREYNATVRAIEDGDAPVAPPATASGPAAKPARKPRAKAAPDTPKPARAPRKKKADEA